MQFDKFIGWDLGGAHLKLAQVDLNGQLRHIRQWPCPIWKGIHYLDEALDQAMEEVSPEWAVHAVTMTAELADIFHTRIAGVQVLVDRMSTRLGAGELRIFAGKAGWLHLSEMKGREMEIASANWLASASFAAQRCEGGILIDIGSTTTDIIEFRNRNLWYRGYSDGERLRTGELVYSGVTRTPVMAVVRKIPFEGEWQSLTAEHFATMADVYQLTGRLTELAEIETICAPLFDTADGAGQAPDDCARRLARMLGRDLESAPLEQWRGMAHYIARAHLGVVREAVERVLSRSVETHNLPLIGAGIGRFLAREIAIQLGHAYRDFSELVEGPPELRGRAAICAPAAALAYLARIDYAATQDQPDSL